jgi:adenylosuccinate synthase
MPDGHPTTLRAVPAIVIVGAQWGDEGKGKIIDVLAEHAQVVARYQGGSNAGHTVIVDDEEFKFHLLPSGVLNEDALCVLGNGVVIEPEVLCRELDELQARGRSGSGLRISGNAHLVMPWHRLVDGARELRLGDLAIGTTKRGIGPAYADKAARVGIRVQDLLDEKILRAKVATALDFENDVLDRVYGLDRLDPAAVADEVLAFAPRLCPYIADTSLLIAQALDRGELVLCEGAQGTLLDLDQGTYPFVTSSNPIAGGACVGLGIGPTRISTVVGVAKAYLTRVGEGPFPSEAEPAAADALRIAGGEFGVTTGRPRRCGWLDAVALRYAARVNGMTELVVTKLDVLSEHAEIPVCTAYELADGTITRDFPAHQSDFHHARPVLEVSAGWQRPIADVRRAADLPVEARDYLDLVEREVGVPVTLAGVGQRRDQILALPGAESAVGLVAL